MEGQMAGQLPGHLLLRSGNPGGVLKNRPVLAANDFTVI
jgi:hypothetical protein